MTAFGEDTSNVPKGTDKSAEAVSLARQGVGIAQNPASIVQMGLKVLPHAALVAFAIQLTPMIMEFLARPGGPMVVRWKRIIEAEMNGFMDRQTQRNSQIGTRAISIQSRAGFIGINGANNSNNLREIREGGVNKDRLARTPLRLMVPPTRTMRDALHPVASILVCFCGSMIAGSPSRTLLIRVVVSESLGRSTRYSR